jgi:hypothetical protein
MGSGLAGPYSMHLFAIGRQRVPMGEHWGMQGLAWAGNDRGFVAKEQWFPGCVKRSRWPIGFFCKLRYS